MFNSRKRRGFTLPEVLVTVAIVAVLAAIVVPAVTSQMDKADGPALQTSLGALRTGVTAFVSDVRKFPKQISDLSNAVLATDSALYGTGLYGSRASDWKGPYTAFTLADGDTLDLGMSLAGLDTLVIGNNMVQMNLIGITLHAEISKIDTLIDNATGATAGNLRWTAAPPNASAIKYYLTSAK